MARTDLSGTWRLRRALSGALALCAIALESPAAVREILDLSGDGAGNIVLSPRPIARLRLHGHARGRPALSR